MSGLSASIVEWQVAVLESAGIDAGTVSAATIIIGSEMAPRIIVEHIPGDLTLPKFTKQYRLVEVET
jgi:hypothetical protein